MTPRCQEPDLQTAALEQACGHEALDEQVAEHLQSCPSCRTAAERIRRVVSVWRADQVDDEIAASAAARFEAGGRARAANPSWLESVPFALAGAAAAYALLIATRVVGVPWATPTSGSASATLGVATPERDRSAVVSLPHIKTSQGIVLLADGLRLELKKGESAHVALRDGHFADLHGPCVVEFWSSPTEVGGFRFSRTDLEVSAPPSGAVEQVPEVALGDTPSGRQASPMLPSHAPRRETATNQAGSASPAFTVDEPSDLSGPQANPAYRRAWARAAAALRRDDFQAADSAFEELGRAPEAATRDAARLARAQLWIAHGRAAAVRPVLEDLAQKGATALVRQRAAEFLSREAQ